MIKSYYNMFEVRKNILFANDYLSPPFLRISLESIAYIRTYYGVLVHINGLEVENLTVLKISQSVSCHKSHPIFVSHCIKKNTSYDLTVVGSNCVGKARYPCDFLKGVFRGQPQSIFIRTDHFAPSLF